MLIEVMASSGREIRDVFRAATATHRRLRDHLLTIAVATVGIDLLCAIVAFVLERHSQQTEIKFGSAAFWTTTQLLTVSSQIKNPISTGGRRPHPGRLHGGLRHHCHRNPRWGNRQLPSEARRGDGGQALTSADSVVNAAFATQPVA